MRIVRAVLPLLLAVPALSQDVQRIERERGIAENAYTCGLIAGAVKVLKASGQDGVAASAMVVRPAVCDVVEELLNTPHVVPVPFPVLASLPSEDRADHLRCSVLRSSVFPLLACEQIVTPSLTYVICMAVAAK